MKERNGKVVLTAAKRSMSFLAKDGILAETEDAAIKEIIAYQIKVAMNKQELSKTEMGERMKTSRRQLDRLLDPDNSSGWQRRGGRGARRGEVTTEAGVNVLQRDSEGQMSKVVTYASSTGYHSRLIAEARRVLLAGRTGALRR